MTNDEFLNQCGYWGMTPIHFAAWYGSTQSVERLKDKYDSN